jgi:exodeoxyribonuclease VII large subunit
MTTGKRLHLQTYTVSQINRHIKNMLSEDFVLRAVCISGEVSDCKYLSTGHISLSLKDKSSKLSVYIWANIAAGLAFHVENGQTIVCTGKIDLYEKNGTYSLSAYSVTRAGIGEMYEAYERLKQKLAAQGYFDIAHKRALPAYPSTVGIVTAQTGAAIGDIQTVARRRDPYIRLVLAPAKVQGQGAAETIARAIKRLDAEHCDIMIVGRGGGSTEDLWAFNEEIVADAVYRCRTPVVSAVGHEQDVALCDLVADMRAPTPSAAAELCVPLYDEKIAALAQYHAGLAGAVQRKIAQLREETEDYGYRLSVMSPKKRLEGFKLVRDYKCNRLSDLMQNRLRDAKHALAIYSERVESRSPLGMLRKGYSHVTDERGKTVKSYKDVQTGAKINVQVSDGVVFADVTRSVGVLGSG